MAKCTEHVPDMMAFRFTVCREGHSAQQQRTCLKCGKNYCMECSGQTFERGKELFKEAKAAEREGRWARG